jgi:hypothetical protein
MAEAQEKLFHRNYLVPAFGAARWQRLHDCRPGDGFHNPLTRKRPMEGIRRNSDCILRAPAVSSEY